MTASSWCVLIHHPTRAEEYASALRQRFPELEIELTSEGADLARRIASADVLVISAAIPIPDGVLERAARLRWIQVTSAGVNCIMTTAIPPGVRITRVTGSFGRQMSEYVLAYLLGAFYQLPRTFDNQRRRRWEHFVPRPLAESTVGVAGTGAIGGAIARSLSALGCRLWGLARHPQPVEGFERVFGPGDWHEFLPSLDVLVLALPLTAETSHVIGRAELDLLKPTAYLVNVSRGALIDEPALITSLEEGRLGGAILDVFATEPLPVDSPLWGMPDVCVTSHIAGTGDVRDFVAAFAANVSRLRAGEPLLDEVDREAGY